MEYDLKGRPIKKKANGKKDNGEKKKEAVKGPSGVRYYAPSEEDLRPGYRVVPSEPTRTVTGEADTEEVKRRFEAGEMIDMSVFKKKKR